MLPSGKSIRKAVSKSLNGNSMAGKGYRVPEEDV